MRRGYTLIELLAALFFGMVFIIALFIFVYKISDTTDTTMTRTSVEKKFDAVVGTFNGHSYVHFTSYPMKHTVLHDPDCPCRLKAEQE